MCVCVRIRLLVETGAAVVVVKVCNLTDKQMDRISCVTRERERERERAEKVGREIRTQAKWTSRNTSEEETNESNCYNIHETRHKTR